MKHTFTIGQKVRVVNTNCQFDNRLEGKAVVIESPSEGGYYVSLNRRISFVCNGDIEPIKRGRPSKDKSTGERLNKINKRREEIKQSVTKSGTSVSPTEPVTPQQEKYPSQRIKEIYEQVFGESIYGDDLYRLFITIGTYLDEQHLARGGNK